MVIVIFRLRVREGVAEEELLGVGQRMYELGSSMPGFLSYKEFQAEDGEYIYIVEYESEEAAVAWRDHPEHQAAQRRGRDEFFSEYHVQICQPMREYQFSGGSRQEIKIAE
jgi:heme-degrading monooxygenase HmoA